MKSVVVFSGGLDSTVLLYKMRQAGEVVALSVDYGQRHRKELDAAGVIAKRAGVKHHVVDLSSLREVMGGSSQTDDNVPVPLGHYAAESMKQTVVPNRNMVLIAVAVSCAITHKASVVAYAAHGGDHTIYPDCRPEFADAMNKAVSLCDWHSVRLLRPFMNIDKAALVRSGIELKAPLHLTWSCYCGGDKHCGKCGTCVERREAFVVAGITDPTEYAK